MPIRTTFNMPAIVADIDQRAERAVYAAMTALDAVQATNVPIDTSALANNRTIKITGVAGRVEGKVVFMQKYAAAVQAMVGVNWKRPDAIDQWLSESAKEAKSDIDATVFGVMRL